MFERRAFLTAWPQAPLPPAHAAHFVHGTVKSKKNLTPATLCCLQVRPHDLKKHLLKCEAAKLARRRAKAATLRAAQPTPAYFECGINSGSGCKGVAEAIPSNGGSDCDQRTDCHNSHGVNGAGSECVRTTGGSTSQSDVHIDEGDGAAARSALELSPEAKVAFLRGLMATPDAIWTQPVPTIASLADVLPPSTQRLVGTLADGCRTGAHRTVSPLSTASAKATEFIDVADATPQLGERAAPTKCRSNHSACCGDGIDEAGGADDACQIDVGRGCETTGSPSERTIKHQVQEVAITAHLSAAGLVGPHPHPAALVELGAGRGGLSRQIQTEFPGTPTVLVDCAEVKPRHDLWWRLKPDTANADKSTANDCNCSLADGEAVAPEMPHVFNRVTIDIRHLKLANLPGTANLPLTLAAKHLCGVASDLAINAATNAASSRTPLLPHMDGQPRTDSTDAAGRVSSMSETTVVAGVAIATCCHQLCLWEDYPAAGKVWLLHTCGAGTREFELLKQCAGWAVDGGPTRLITNRTQRRRNRVQNSLANAQSHAATGDAIAVAEVGRLHSALDDAMKAREWRDAIPAAERASIGRACKIVLDLGRKAALSAAGFHCELLEYCAAGVTLENRLLLAWRKGSTNTQRVMRWPLAVTDTDAAESVGCIE